MQYLHRFDYKQIFIFYLIVINKIKCYFGFKKHNIYLWVTQFYYFFLFKMNIYVKQTVNDYCNTEIMNHEKQCCICADNAVLIYYFISVVLYSDTPHTMSHLDNLCLRAITNLRGKNMTVPCSGRRCAGPIKIQK
jgi:hypothetical protein